MRFINPEVTDFVGKITRFYWDFHWEYEHIIGCVINDPLAVAHFLHEDLCQGFDSFVDLATEGIAVGQTLVDAYHFYGKEANSKVLTQVNTQLFFQDFLSVILNTSKEIICQDLETLNLG